MERDIREAIIAASMTNDLKFSGYRNTVELIDTVKELFSFFDIKIDNVEGKIDCFRANLSANIVSEKDVEGFIESYCNNNQESVKVATSR